MIKCNKLLLNSEANTGPKTLQVNQDRQTTEIIKFIKIKKLYKITKTVNKKKTNLL